jgi:hypothetical protein
MTADRCRLLNLREIGAGGEHKLAEAEKEEQKVAHLEESWLRPRALNAKLYHRGNNGEVNTGPGSIHEKQEQTFLVLPVWSHH